jgi:hypothetical protein
MDTETAFRPVNGTAFMRRPHPMSTGRLGQVQERCDGA